MLLRLPVKSPLLQFTRPDNSPVWVKAGAVTNVTPPLPPGQYAPQTHSVIWLGQLRQAVTQTPDVVVAQIRGAAGTASLIAHHEALEQRTGSGATVAAEPAQGNEKGRHGATQHALNRDG